MPLFSAKHLAADPQGWSGRASGTVYLATSLDPSLRASTSSGVLAPEAAFGWATAFKDVPSAAVDIDSSASRLVHAEYGVGRYLGLTPME